MSKDTIYRQDAIDLVKDVCDAILSGCDSYYDSETGDEVYKDILEVDAILKCNKEIRIALRNMPSAQPKVIQCKDCKYSAMIYSTNMVPVVGGFRAEGIDPIFCQCDKHGGIEMRWDDFCSRAERRKWR